MTATRILGTHIKAQPSLHAILTGDHKTRFLMKKVLINVEERELRVAILEDEQLVELYIESLDEKSILNNIYKGRIEDVLPGLKAAFVNVGLDRNAFLHFDDVRPDLLWAKYREMHPELADEVPTAREALAETIEADQDDSSDEAENGDRRKRRRGRRGGKKRRPDAEDSYSPGLPVGVTEDDLEDEEEEETDAAIAAAPDRSESTSAGRDASSASADADSADFHEEAEAESQPVAGEGEVEDGHAASEAEARKLARQERQKRRRERWEQRKLERQQRRQQERLEREQSRAAGTGNEHGAEEDEAVEDEAPIMPAAYGTRGAASAYDNLQTQHMTANQRRQNKQRYGDNFGNIAVNNPRRHDHRDSQVDFFGPVVSSAEEEFSVWDERQPNLGPVPGLGKGFLDLDGNTRRRARHGHSHGQRQGFNGNGHGGNRKPGNHNNKPTGGKRRGGKKRSMRKRDNRSFFAFSLDDADTEQANLTAETTASEAADTKPKRTRKTAAAKAEKSEAKPAAARKSTAKRTTKAKAVAPAETPEYVEAELPWGDIASLPAGDKAVTEKAAAEEKPKRTRKATTTRKRKADVATSASAEHGDLVNEALSAKEDPKAAVSPAETPRAETSISNMAAETADAPGAPNASLAKETSAADTGKKAHEPQKQAGHPTDAAPESQNITAGSDETAGTEGSTAAAPAADSEHGTPGAAASDSEVESDRRRRSGRQSRAERAARHRERRNAQREQAKAGGALETASASDEQSSEVASKESGSSEVEHEPAAPPDQTSGVEAEAHPQQGTSSEEAQGQPSSSHDKHHGKHQHPKHQHGNGAASPNGHGQNAHGQKRDRDSRRRLRKPLFQEVFKKGDEIMVQVVKEEIGMKGARISSYVSLPGRYLVLLPYPNQEGGISRKVEDVKERKRLKTLLRDISSDDTAFIVRTAGIYQDETEIRNDVEFLNQEWKQIADKFASVEPKSLVYDDHDILYRLARDVFDDSVAEILIDSHIEGEKLKGILGKLIPGLVEKVKVYSGAENIFHKFGVNKQIQKAARRKVWLKSGGYLIIDEAEALTAIDVNTGKSVGKDDQEKLILRTNLEAARAVARELKLRDIGGLIVIDFIDMKDARNKEQVLHELKLQLRKDRSKTSVSAISEFGLVEMTRKRVRRSLRKTIFMDCPYCQGAGAVLNEQQIWLHIKHEIVRQLEGSRPAPTLNITVNPKIRAYVDQNYKDVIRRLEQKYDTEIRIGMSDIYHIENYQIERMETTGVINGSATMPAR